MDPASALLERQLFICGPLRQRAVVDGHGWAADGLERERRRGRGDTAAAVGNDAFGAGHGRPGEGVLERLLRDQRAAIRLGQVDRRNVDAAGDPAWSLEPGPM